MWNIISFPLGFLIGGLGVYVSHKGFCNEEKVKKPKIKKDEEPKIVMEEFPSEEEKEKKRIELEELEKKERAELEIEALVKDVMVDKKRSCHKCHVYDWGYKQYHCPEKYKDFLCLEHEQVKKDLFKKKFERWEKDGKIE